MEFRLGNRVRVRRQQLVLDPANPDGACARMVADTTVYRVLVVDAEAGTAFVVDADRIGLFGDFVPLSSLEPAGSIHGEG